MSTRLARRLYCGDIIEYDDAKYVVLSVVNSGTYDHMLLTCLPHGRIREPVSLVVVIILSHDAKVTWVGHRCDMQTTNIREKKSDASD